MKARRHLSSEPPLVPAHRGGRLPEALVALEPGEHLDLELARAEAEALAPLLVEKRPRGPEAELTHPCEEGLVRVAPRRAKDVGGLVSPADRDDQHAQLVGPEFLGERALGLQPAADEVPARVDRPAIVDRAAALPAEEARLPGLHLVPLDRALDPAVAARGAGAARPLRRRVAERDHRAAALLVFLPAAAGTRIVSSDGHRKSLAACKLAVCREPRRSISWSFCRCSRASGIAAARCWCRSRRWTWARTPSPWASSPRCTPFSR